MFASRRPSCLRSRRLWAEALGLGPAFDGLLGINNARPLSLEPSLTMALEDDCRRQCRLMIETRTNAYQVRRNDYPEETISVYFTVRQYGSLPHDGSFEETLKGELFNKYLVNSYDMKNNEELHCILHNFTLE